MLLFDSYYFFSCTKSADNNLVKDLLCSVSFDNIRWLNFWFLWKKYFKAFKKAGRFCRTENQSSSVEESIFYCSSSPSSFCNSSCYSSSPIYVFQWFFGLQLTALYRAVTEERGDKRTVRSNRFVAKIRSSFWNGSRICYRILYNPHN